MNASTASTGVGSRSCQSPGSQRSGRIRVTLYGMSVTFLGVIAVAETLGDVRRDHTRHVPVAVSIVQQRCGTVIVLDVVPGGVGQLATGDAVRLVTVRGVDVD